MVHEITRYRKIDINELLRQLRGRITQAHEIVPSAIVLIRGGSIPKTTSGKIQRRECKQRFEDGVLDVIAEWRSNADGMSPEASQAAVLTNGEQAPSEVPPVTSSRSNGHGMEAADRMRTKHRRHEGSPPDENQIFVDVSSMLRNLNPLSGSVVINRETCLFADLGLASIDAVMLQADIENYYQRRFAFREFIAEIGGREVPDISLRDLVEFLHREFATAALFTTAASSHVTARGLKFYYRQEGEGPNVVLIHGVGGNMAVWYLCGLVRELARRFRVTVYDLRGHGHSQRTESGYTSNDMAEDLHAIQLELGIRQPIYLGHSFGAAIAMQMAVKYPKNVAGVVLSDAYFPGLAEVQGAPGHWPGWAAYQAVATHIGIEVSDEWDNLADLFQQVADLTGDQRKLFIKIAGNATYQRLLQIASTSCGRDVADEAGLTQDRILSVTQPVVCLYGEQSPFRPLCEYLSEHLEDCSISIVPQAEHFAFEENPAEFVRLANNAILGMTGFAIPEDAMIPSTGTLRNQTLFTNRP